MSNNGVEASESTPLSDDEILRRLATGPFADLLPETTRAIESVGKLDAATLEEWRKSFTASETGAVIVELRRNPAIADPTLQPRVKEFFARFDENVAAFIVAPEGRVLLVGLSPSADKGAPYTRLGLVDLNEQTLTTTIGGLKSPLGKFEAEFVPFLVLVNRDSARPWPSETEETVSSTVVEDLNRQIRERQEKILVLAEHITKVAKQIAADDHFDYENDSAALSFGSIGFVLRTAQIYSKEGADKNEDLFQDFRRHVRVIFAARFGPSQDSVSVTRLEPAHDRNDRERFDHLAQQWAETLQTEGPDSLLGKFLAEEKLIFDGLGRKNTDSYKYFVEMMRMKTAATNLFFDLYKATVDIKKPF